VLSMRAGTDPSPSAGPLPASSTPGAAAPLRPRRSRPSRPPQLHARPTSTGTSQPWPAIAAPGGSPQPLHSNPTPLLTIIPTAAPSGRGGGGSGPRAREGASAESGAEGGPAVSPRPAGPGLWASAASSRGRGGGGGARLVARPEWTESGEAVVWRGACTSLSQRILVHNTPHQPSTLHEPSAKRPALTRVRPASPPRPWMSRRGSGTLFEHEARVRRVCNDFAWGVDVGVCGATSPKTVWVEL
jgi:hypothetical protein